MFMLVKIPAWVMGELADAFDRHGRNAGGLHWEQAWGHGTGYWRSSTQLNNVTPALRHHVPLVPAYTSHIKSFLDLSWPLVS